MSRCMRCDWHATAEDERPDVEQLADHSLDAAHPLCTVCHHSLPPAEGMACDKCLTEAREHLAGILLMYDELPSLLGHTGSSAFDTDRPGASDGHPLPGGDALVLLGPGSEGLSEDYLTTREGDPTSVAFELGWWEQELRQSRGDIAVERPRSAAAAVRSAGAYLEVHSRWAATSHAGFDQLAADLRRLHRMLERVTSRAERQIIAEAECFDCGGDLVREIQPRQDDANRVGKLGLKNEGYADDFTCQRCGRVYDWPSYLLAVRSRLEAVPGSGWVLPEQAATSVGVSPKTIRTWARRGVIAVACAVLPGIRDPRLRVLPEDVQTASTERQAS